MRWRGRRMSSNIEDQTGMRGGGLGGGLGGGGIGLPVGRMGIGGLVVMFIIALIFGINPMQIAGGVDPQAAAPPAAPVQPGSGAGCERSEAHAFSCTVLAETEDTWRTIFQQAGQTYPEPKLVFYAGRGQSGCGAAQSATGPFYCPADQKVYLDTSFFDEMERKLGAGGDFAYAYVVAHEVGHHVQTVTGISEQVMRAQRRASRTESNALQVRMELQADCYAGIWAKSAQELIEPGDIEEAMNAAQAIGDDRLQREAQGYVVPDSFTHGTSEQRMRWFQTGYSSGSVDACDTFSARAI